MVYRGRPAKTALCDRLSAKREKANMIEELDDVILACDLPEDRLSAGDIGTVVLVHRNACGGKEAGEAVHVNQRAGGQIQADKRDDNDR